jgi:cathepsin B
MVDHINSQQTTWKAVMSPRFEGWTLAQAKGLMGSLPGGEMPAEATHVLQAAPTSFDSRSQWKNCSSIPLVRDQSACGSCWAFGSTESFNDRYCIATGKDVIFAVNDVLSCCTFTCGAGCEGGYPPQAWSYFKRSGVVTDSCDPYPFPACAHHVVTDDYPPCPSADYETPACNKTCDDGTDFNDDKTFAVSTYSITKVNNIMAEISTYGPVTASFSVYEDFMSYSTGVYQHTTGEYVGGHAIEIIGYGTDNGVDYWTVKNSWNPSWGEDGYFRIRKGNNECGIEGSVVAGLAA